MDLFGTVMCNCLIWQFWLDGPLGKGGIGFICTPLEYFKPLFFSPKISALTKKRSFHKHSGQCLSDSGSNCCAFFLSLGSQMSEGSKKMFRYNNLFQVDFYGPKEK